MMTFPDALAIAVNAASIALAIVAIYIALSSRREAAASALDAAKSLAEIRAETAKITTTVESHLNKLIDQISQIADAAVPRPPSQQDMMQAGMMQLLTQNPETFIQIMQAFQAAGVDLSGGTGPTPLPDSPSPDAK
jgi:hypothetical protein